MGRARIGYATCLGAELEDGGGDGKQRYDLGGGEHPTS